MNNQTEIKPDTEKLSKDFLEDVYFYIHHLDSKDISYTLSILRKSLRNHPELVPFKKDLYGKKGKMELLLQDISKKYDTEEILALWYAYFFEENMLDSQQLRQVQIQNLNYAKNNIADLLLSLNNKDKLTDLSSLPSKENLVIKTVRENPKTKLKKKSKDKWKKKKKKIKMRKQKKKK